MALSFKEVAEILQLIDASDCAEFVLEVEGLKLVVRRGGAAGSDQPVIAPSSGEPVRSPATSPEVTSAPAFGSVNSASDTTGDLPDGEVIRAPMVGTFYRKPSPEEPAFVEVGSTVKAGEMLALIEVMKLFTSITAPIDGTVVAIMVEDGAGVEFDMPLIVIKPA